MRGWFATLNVVSGQRTADYDYLGFLQRSFGTMDAMRDDKKLARRPTTRHPACDDLLTDRASSSSPVCQCLTQPVGQRDVDTVAAVHACGAVRRRQHAVRLVQLYGRPPAVQIGRRRVGLLARDGARAANLSVMSPRHARIAHNKCRSPAGVH